MNPDAVTFTIDSAGVDHKHAIAPWGDCNRSRTHPVLSAVDLPKIQTEWVEDDDTPGRPVDNVNLPGFIERDTQWLSQFSLEPQAEAEGPPPRQVEDEYTPTLGIDHIDLSPPRSHSQRLAKACAWPFIAGDQATQVGRTRHVAQACGVTERTLEYEARLLGRRWPNHWPGPLRRGGRWSLAADKAGAEQAEPNQQLRAAFGHGKNPNAGFVPHRWIGTESRCPPNYHRALCAHPC